MFRNTWNQGTSQASGHTSHQRARRLRRARGKGRSTHLWGIEQLEERRVLASLSWQGDIPGSPPAFIPQWNAGVPGTNTNWTTNAQPADGDQLTFPVGPLLTVANNDTTLNNSYTLELTGGTYALSGNAITLDNPGPDVVVSGGASTGHLLSMPLRVDGTTEIQVIDTNLLTLQGVISETSVGTGSLTKTRMFRLATSSSIARSRAWLRMAE